jgi:hypothetical protein
VLVPCSCSAMRCDSASYALEKPSKISRTLEEPPEMLFSVLFGSWMERLSGLLTRPSIPILPYIKVSSGYNKASKESLPSLRDQ